MPQDNKGNDYSYKSSGTNDQEYIAELYPSDVADGYMCAFLPPCASSGNHYCSRDYGNDASNGNSYHYSNQDGSYYYSNSNGSTYYNDGKGGSSYNPSGGSGKGK
ncbi:MAG: hypothetical protein M1815_002031 [Lichina confinis]|nr:MAG: hypothetical protein M1815_002031 [Lichina confinis]